jgi:predicted DNA-binding transcriptional regulator YafY
MMLLQVNRRLTARGIAERLEVSERTIHRDMEALSAAGIPVYAERGSNGGWSLIEEFRTNLTGLSKMEVQSLFLTSPSRLLADLGLEKASDAALIKLLASLPSANRSDAEYARQRIHIDITGWNRPEEAIPLLHVVQEAIWKEHKLRFTYSRHGCDDIERLVEPLGLVAKGSVWYLVASIEGEIRNYRVSRITSAEIKDEKFTRPEGFDLPACWEKSNVEFKAQMPKYYATLRVSPDVLPRMYIAGRFARVEKVGEAEEDGWIKVWMRFHMEWDASEYVLSFGSKVEVVEPDELRESVIRMAKSVIDFYDRRAMSQTS